LVPFKPDPAKAVYCNECFEIIKNKKREALNGEQTLNEVPVTNQFSNTKTSECETPPADKTADLAMEQKRKEIKEKIDNSGLADTLKNIFKN